MWGTLRELAGLSHAPRDGWCVAAVLEVRDLGALAQKTDAERFVVFLREAAVQAARQARAGDGRASAVEAGTFLACFPGERSGDPAAEALRWVVESRRAIDALAGWAALGTARARFAAGIAAGHGAYGAPPGPVVAGEAAHVADRLRLAAREEGWILVDEYLVLILAPERRFEAVRARAGETEFRAHRLIGDDQGRPAAVRPAGL